MLKIIVMLDCNIFQESRGILREINNFATLAILRAESSQCTNVDLKMMRKILDQRELN